MQLVDVEGCNNEEISEIREIINEFSGVFGLEGEPLPASHLIKHNIQLISNTSINTRRYRYPPALKEQIQNEIDKLLEQDIIEPSNSNYSSAMWIVPKKADAQGNKKWRLVTDFRQLNESTVGSCHPLPFTSDILEHLASANYITVMDLKQGFYQIEMDPESAPFTAFSAPVGRNGQQHLQYKRMGMGLKEAPITFSKAMSLAMAGLQGEEVEIYLDDLMIFGDTVEVHNKRLRRVLKRLLDANLTVEPKKCQFLKREAKVLGHILGEGIIRIDPKKLTQNSYPVPTNAKKVKQWISFAGYFSRFIPNFADITYPISKLQQKSVKFVWG